MLKPLQEWICDSCGEVISSPKEGYLEWLSDDDHKAYDFVMVHHAIHSPKRSGKDCYLHAHSPRSSSSSLDNYTGPNAQAYLYRFLDFGEYHDPDNTGPKLKDIREFVNLMRRLTIPYYEEARRYFGETKYRDMLAGGANEILMFTPAFLKQVIEECQEEEDE